MSIKTRASRYRCIQVDIKDMVNNACTNVRKSLKVRTGEHKTSMIDMFTRISENVIAKYRGN